MHRASLLVSLVIGLSLSAVACGGMVVFDDGGSGGSGGTGASGPGSTVGPSTSTGTVSSSSGPSSTCEYFCDRLAPCLGSEDCGEACASVYVPGCESEADAFIRCLSDAVAVPSCSYEGGCEGLDAAYQACAGIGPDCSEGQCSVGDNQCGCDAVCQGREVGTYCFVQPNGTTRCTCYLDGGLIGTCDQDVFDCSVEASCCQGVWFGFDDGPPPPPPN
jgi:hypothetical protein